MFKNAAFVDYTSASVRDAQQRELDNLKHSLSAARIVKPIINGIEIDCVKSQPKIDPNDGSTVLGTIHLADAKLGASALEALQKARCSWENTPVSERANILRKAAALMDQRRLYLNALICRESAKPWLEADKDTVEAIDFCNYYAEQAEKQLGRFRTQETPGEANFYFYDPRGIAAIIGPWNFPLAIPCGMLVAALVAGNVAILKPASQSCLIAAELVKILFAAGLPTQVLAFLPGSGEEIGSFLINSPSIDLICFTGSLAVGQKILRACSEISPEIPNIRKAILELGGKNAIIVDDDADPDDAVKAILYSAFGYSGQKCSACSRLIVVGSGYPKFISRLIAAARDLIIGPSYSSATYVGPLIDRSAQQRVLEFIESAAKRQTASYISECPKRGFFVPLTIFENVQAEDPLFQEEIFGPVLAICQAEDLTQALQLANNSKYALTGGFFSRSPANIERVIREFKVGNLYINRACTGAIVERHPFGGFRLSGIGSKAGGVDYIKQFVVPRSLSENTLRKGFTPDLQGSNK